MMNMLSSFRLGFSPPRSWLLALLIPLVSGYSAALLAQEPPRPDDSTLRVVVQKAILNSPDVQARWHVFQEASEEISVARGDFLPRVDWSVGSARETLQQRAFNVDESFYRRTQTLSLSQMLFDGFATLNDVKRLGKAKLTRYFELLDASENIALEATKAYLDVVRARQLVRIAEENYVQHQLSYDQLKQRMESGLGKRVDLEQASSRLALADVNAGTAYANLHDISARYVRVIGEPPPEEMPVPELDLKQIPDSVDAALRLALANNPALRAANENVEAAQHDLQARRARLLPRVDLRARNESINNNLNTPGYRDNSVVEVVMSYNLFNGGADFARTRQYRERKNTAIDQREKTCRDIRQALSVAYNETRRLNEQMPTISRQVHLVEKTRAAYRDQFNIGQRTLLDLLNTQNEFFDARRAQVNADTDLALAYLRTYAGMGNLLKALNLKALGDDDTPNASELAQLSVDQLCPATHPSDLQLDREALNRQAKTLLLQNAENASNRNNHNDADKALVAPLANPASAEPADTTTQDARP
ncbi:MAG: TolC family outer membrane protein [Pseudomonadota bacterium]